MSGVPPHQISKDLAIAIITRYSNRTESELELLNLDAIHSLLAEVIKANKEIMLSQTRQGYGFTEQQLKNAVVFEYHTEGEFLNTVYTRLVSKGVPLI